MNDEESVLSDYTDIRNTPESVRQLLQREKERLTLLQAITATANEANSVEEAFERALDLICTHTGWTLAHVFMRETLPDGTFVLASSNIYFCEGCEGNEQFTLFQEVTTNTTFSLGQGWLGSVFADKAPAWQLHVRERPDFRRRPQLQGLGIETAFAFPVLAADEVMAVMEFFATASLDPDEELLQIMANIGTQLGRVIERANAAAKISQSRDFYLQLFEKFPFPVWQADAKGQWNYFNETWLNFTGQEMEMCLEEGWLTRIHPEDREKWRQAFREAVARQHSFDAEYRLRRHDGAYHWIRNYVQLFHNVDGEPGGFIGACADINDYVETASQLRRRELLLAEAQSVAQVGSWELDADTREMRASEELYEILGVDRAAFEFTPENLLSLIHPEDRKGFLSHQEQDKYQRRETWEVVQRIVRPDGAVRHLRIRNKPVLDEDGRVIRIIGIAQDITEQRALETRLEHHRAFLDEAQRLAQMGNWEYDLETHEGIFSDQVYRMYQLDPQKDVLTQETLFAMEAPEDRVATRERLQRIMEEKQPYTAHFQIYRPDGERRHMEAYVVPLLNGKGKVYKLRGTVQDITQRRRAEEEVEKQLQRFVFLNEMGQTVVSTLDLTRVLNRALEALRPLLNAEGVFVLLGEEEEEMRFAAADHARYESDLTHLRLPLDRSVAGIAVRTGEPQWLTDDKDDSRFFEQITEVTGYPTRSLITIPLKIQNRVIGVLEAVHSRPDAFVEDDVLTLTAAASWIAIAIENAHLYSEVERNKRRYRALAEDIVWAQEEERRRISRELHDDVGQGMIALSLQLELLGRQVEDEGLQDDLQGVKELMGSIIQRLRILSYNLRPPELDTIGLHAALSDLCRTYQKRLNLPVRFEGEELPTGVSDAIVLSFYRFLQEALTNVIKHASATQVEVKLSYNGETIRLYVTDNGRGFTPSAKNLNDGSGLGLLGMKERFTSLNGNIQITSRRGQGTEIEAFIPW